MMSALNFSFYSLIKRTGVVILMLIFDFPLQAQNLGFEETLTYINSKLGEEFTVNVERGIIIANYYTQDKKLYRQDQVNPRDLDTNKIYYDQTEKLFIINCLGTRNKCVDRNLYVNKISRTYSRISFNIALDNKSIAGLKKAFRHLIKLATLSKYKNNEPFE